LSNYIELSIASKISKKLDNIKRKPNNLFW